MSDLINFLVFFSAPFGFFGKRVSTQVVVLVEVNLIQIAKIMKEGGGGRMSSDMIFALCRPCLWAGWSQPTCYWRGALTV